jgi:hypothetical protein
MAATSAYATQFIGYTDTNCKAGALEITTNDHSGSCNEISATGSVTAQNIDSVCTSTYIFSILGVTCRFSIGVAGYLCALGGGTLAVD